MADGPATGVSPSLALGGAGAPPPRSAPPACAVATAFVSPACDDEDGPGAEPTVTGLSHCGGQRTSAYCGWVACPEAATNWASGPVSSGLENASALGELSRWALASG